MAGRVAVIGVGATVPRAVTPEASYRELTFEAAQRAYADAGISHKDVQSVVCCEEDLHEGISISDEYTPDQLGAVLRSVETVCGDGLHGLAVAAMQIQTGAIDVAVVEAHSKASNILTFDHITAYALDPVWTAPLGFHPDFLAGMEMNRLAAGSPRAVEACDRIAAKNRTAALANPMAAYPVRLSQEDVARSPLTFSPMRELHASRRADGAVVLVLAGEERAKKSSRPVWIRGTGWANDTPTLASRPWDSDEASKRAAAIAYQEAGIQDPRKEIGIFEVDDLYAHRELMALSALGLSSNPVESTLKGETSVNLSGGSLGMGHLLDATGLYRAARCVQELRRAGSGRALAHAWRGIPTTSAAVAIFASDHA
jgi:acetyl-CoA C-acetyltransferase